MENRKFIKTVTLTGADDSINPESLKEISKQYPFVEWGILLSKSAEGSYRFPSQEWINKLRETVDDEMNLSGHLCGRWVRDVCKGDWSFYENRCEFSMFKRLQLNFHAIAHKIDAHSFYNVAWPFGLEFIFQLDDVNNGLLMEAKDRNIRANGLFDLSGGAGILPSKWPASHDYIGYAGGLSPDNLEENLINIEKVCGNEIWIDAETHLRSNGDQLFNLNKCVEFLEIAKKYVIQQPVSSITDKMKEI